MISLDAMAAIIVSILLFIIIVVLRKEIKKLKDKIKLITERYGIYYHIYAYLEMFFKEHGSMTKEDLENIIWAANQHIKNIKKYSE